MKSWQMKTHDTSTIREGFGRCSAGDEVAIGENTISELTKP